MPTARVHTAEAVAADQAVDAPDADGPAPNPNPDGLDPYMAVTVGSPVTLVDDVGKPVAVLNEPGARVEVRAEDGQVRRKVWCSTCAPPTEGWVRTEDIKLASAE